MRQLLPLLLVTGLSWLATAVQAEVAVIVHPSTAVTPTRTDVVNIYLGLDRSLTPLDLEQQAEPRERFYRQLIRRNQAQLRSHWAAFIFTGKGRPPRVIRSQAVMLEQVASDPRSIGYVDSSLVDDRVRVLFVLQ